MRHGDNFKLTVNYSHIDAREYFFCNRVVRCWNSLPAIPDFSSLASFKRLLRSNDMNVFKKEKTRVVLYYYLILCLSLYVHLNLDI